MDVEEELGLVGTGVLDSINENLAVLVHHLGGMGPVVSREEDELAGGAGGADSSDSGLESLDEGSVVGHVVCTIAMKGLSATSEMQTREVKDVRGSFMRPKIMRASPAYFLAS